MFGVRKAIHRVKRDLNLEIRSLGRQLCTLRRRTDDHQSVLERRVYALESTNRALIRLLFPNGINEAHHEHLKAMGRRGQRLSTIKVVLQDEPR